MTCLENAGQKLTKTKCEFMKDEIEDIWSTKMVYVSLRRKPFLFLFRKSYKWKESV